MTLRLPSSGTRLPALVEETFYRIAQEALTNVERHAAARRADVRVTCTRTHARLILRDDGRGFARPKRRRERAPGLGLVNLRERAEPLAHGSPDDAR